MASVTSIVDLKPFKTSWTIKVKVIRLWKQTTGGGGETIDMVLCDVKGNKIHASVKKELVAKYDPFLKEGHSNMFINFSLVHSVGSYRTTTHPYRISFLSKTRVLPSEQLPGELCGFQPVKYNEVLDGSLNPDYLIDIIGHIVKVSHIEHVNVNGQETEKLCVELRNSDDERIPLVLWGNAACDVNYAIQVRSEYTTICVLRFGKINVWNGELCVSNAFNISDIVLDPAMTEVNNFLASLPEDDLPLAIVESQYEAGVNGSSDGDASFRPTPRKTLAEVLQTKQVEKCIVLCTVAAIDADMGWFYWTCKVCSKEVWSVPKYKDDVLEQCCYCATCNTYNPKTDTRYRLHLVVLDNTTNTKFVLFDNHVAQLLNQPLLHVGGPSDKPEIARTDVLLHALNTVVGKTYLFKIGIERENLLNKHQSYPVLKLITDKNSKNRYQDIGCTNAAEGTNIDSMDIHSDLADMSDSFAMRPAKRIRALNRDFGESNAQNSGSNCFSSVMIKKEKLDKSG
ncbi:replication protein A 70 kDa DNA-binding subunit D-like isoform X2 [Brassica rapa]|uniref:replication protein A 70 kDa DNA-binding subunit D-like n=1 Tax=Brassica napus TaxID=3708 RepID=UPI0006AACDEE|nr:replication protein A 70 kDa DNA-binding subunit D-like [Brassica napus]XP_033140786.1 replication protein A 70 kDa DNA-binding subunit D-like isoform X2 [Brassica rapa]